MINTYVYKMHYEYVNRLLQFDASELHGRLKVGAELLETVSAAHFWSVQLHLVHVRE